MEENQAENALLRSLPSFGRILPGLSLAASTLGIETVFLERGRLFCNANSPCSHEGLQQRRVPVPLRHSVGVHAAVIYPANFSILGVQRGSDNLDLDGRSSVRGTACGLTVQVIVQVFGIADTQDLR